MSENLATYLQDHRSGAVAAVELLNHLEDICADTAVSRFAADLRTEVAADIQVLENLMARAGIAPSPTRQAAAWLTAKVAELKMRFEDQGDGALGLLETLEAVALGIDGKRALWAALAATAQRSSTLGGVDYAQLIQRADDQRRGVEEQRLAAAAAALTAVAPQDT